MQMRLHKSKWLVPGFAVVMGVVFLAASGRTTTSSGGLVSLAIMVGVCRGAGRVQRPKRASSRSCAILRPTSAWRCSTCARRRSPASCSITVVIGAFLYDVARGHDPSPYGQLGAVAGIAYLVALIILQRRA